MGQLVTTASTLMCPHGGSVTMVSSARVKAGGAQVMRSNDTFTIAGCPFTVGPAVHPCVRIQWVAPSMQSRSGGDFTVTTDSVGLCLAADQAPQGPPQFVSTQMPGAGR
jgi:hypothetical protein